MDMDISMDIHEKSVDMDMDVDVIFHIHGNPAIITLVPHTAGTTKFSTITRVELGEAYF